jgi:bacillithiol system protein YtxJ
MMTQRLLRDLPAFEAAIAEFPRILLFKHSPLCPISVAARDEYDTFCDEHEDAPTMFIDVIASRAAARGIAESCGVQHESPQAILFEAGEAVWNASHDRITAAALAAAWAPSC